MEEVTIREQANDSENIKGDSPPSQEPPGTQARVEHNIVEAQIEDKDSESASNRSSQDSTFLDQT